MHSQFYLILFFDKIYSGNSIHIHVTHNVWQLNRKFIGCICVAFGLFQLNEATTETYSIKNIPFNDSSRDNNNNNCHHHHYHQTTITIVITIIIANIIQRIIGEIYVWCIWLPFGRLLKTFFPVHAIYFSLSLFFPLAMHWIEADAN